MAQPASMPTALPALTPEMVEMFKAMKASGLSTPKAMLNATKIAQQDIISYGEQNFYIPETGKPVVFEPIQKILLPIIAGSHNYSKLKPFYSTVYWTTPKKMAKTATSGVYARWRAESSTLNDEVLFFANDEAQSRGRAYDAITKSITLNPMYDRVKRVLLDNDGNIVWRIIEDYIEHVPTATKVKAVNVDYRGEAGSNPSLTVWTEIWGYDSVKQERLFDEMTPVLTRERSQRYLEGYAGYVGQSKIQQKVEDRLTKPDLGGRQLTVDDIPDWPWPEEHEGLPVYVNDAAGMFGFIDREEAARKRWYWCTGPQAEDYYKEQAITLAPEQYERLHLNHWVSPVTAFLPIEWHHVCEDRTIQPLQPYRSPLFIREPPEFGATLEPESDLARLLHGSNIAGAQTAGLGIKLLDLYIQPWNWVVLGDAVPMVLAADASVAGDCTGLSAFTRHPVRHQDVVHRRAYKWDPPRGGKLDYNITPCKTTGLSLLQQVLKLCMEYNVVELAYDEWQLHHFMNELKLAGIVWARPFPQAGPRDVADKQLYDLIKERRYSYTTEEPRGELDLASVREHIQNSARKQRAGEDTKAHIIKASEDGKIDLVITMSMGTAECLRLDI